METKEPDNLTNNPRQPITAEPAVFSNIGANANHQVMSSTTGGSDSEAASPVNTCPETRLWKTCRTSFLDYWIVVFVFLITAAVPILYGGPLGLCGNTPTTTQNSIFIIIVSVLIPALSLIGIIWSFRVYRDEKSSYCIKSILALRYGVLVSFFLLFPFLFLYMVLSFMGNDIIFFFSSPLAKILEAGESYRLVYTLMFNMIVWSIFLPIPFYGLQLVRLSVKEKIIEPRNATVHIIAQFIPFLGTLDTLYIIALKWESYRKSSLFLLVFSLLLYDTFLVSFSYISIMFLARGI